MNESTLVPREEKQVYGVKAAIDYAEAESTKMCDLDWLARNVHEWPCGMREVLVCYPRNVDTLIWSRISSNVGWITKEQWLSRRAELQNKPSWKDAPEWAEWLAQDEHGEWKWLAGLPRKYVDGWTAVKIKGCCKGLTIGDWRDTLEKRPKVEPEISYNLNCEGFAPFVSVEDAVREFDAAYHESKPVDAATAMQPAPKGSGNPILGMVLADLTNRALEGKEKYGEPLMAHNGRNPLWDAYQEALDLAMYLRQAIEEQK